MTGKKLFRFRTIAAATATAVLFWLMVRHRRTFFRILAAKTLPLFPTIAIVFLLTALVALVVRRRPVFIPAISGKKSSLIRAVAILSGLAVFAALLVLRRPSEVWHPYVWDEDGTINIPDYLHMGFLSILAPVNGYLVGIPKLINVVSLKLTFLYYPEFSMCLGFLFNLFVLMSIWKAPTVLPGKFFCALATLLIPAGSEVYLLPLYTTWWAGLLIVLALLWTPESASRRGRLARIGFLIAGGLSSPIIILSAPLFLVRALMRRVWKEWGIALIAIAIAAVQVKTVHSNAGNGKVLQTLQQTAIGLGGIQTMVLKYLSWGFFYPCQVPWWAIALVVTAVGCAVGWPHRKPSSVFYLLAPMYFVAVASSLIRGPLWLVDPVHAAPRYFFYPYVFLWWIAGGLAALHIREYWAAAEEVLIRQENTDRIPAPAADAFDTARTSSWLKMGRIASFPNFMGAIICCSLLGTGVMFSSRNYMRNSASDRLHWRESILGSVNSGKPAVIPIQYNGNLSSVWYLTMQPDECKRLIDGSVLDRLVLARHWYDPK